MAEELKTVESTVEEQASTPKQEETTEKVFTQSEVDELIEKRLAKAKKSFDKKLQASLDEADKLRDMSELQKADYEKQKQADRIAELEAELRRGGLEKEATKLLSEAGIVATEELLGFVVGEDAETTLSAVNSFVALVEEVSTAKVQEALKGKTPTKTGSARPAMTAEQFHALSYGEQVKIYQENPELYASFQ